MRLLLAVKLVCAVLLALDLFIGSTIVALSLPAAGEYARVY
jgi:hypothetical protein